METHGDKRLLAKIPEIREFFNREPPRPPNMDDWAACQIKRGEDIRDLFVPHFYFGCEADDPMTTWAFNRRVNPFGARLRAMFGSDISHWDVPDIKEVVPEAYELVEHKLLTEEDFQDFVFGNVVRLHAGANPDFFKGTRVEDAVTKFLKNESKNKSVRQGGAARR